MIKQVIRLSYFMIHDTLCPCLLIRIALRNSHICVLTCYIHSGSVIIIYSRHHKFRHRRPPWRQTSWLLAQPPSSYTSLLPHPLLAKPNDVQEERGSCPTCVNEKQADQLSTQREWLQPPTAAATPPISSEGASWSGHVCAFYCGLMVMDKPLCGHCWTEHLQFH